MQFSISAILIALVATAVTAEPIAERGTPAKCDKYAAKVPSCALQFVMSCAQENGCGPVDYTCGCENQAQLAACALPKIITTCNPFDVVKALAATQQVCDCARS